MVLNYIWIGCFIIAFIVAILQCLIFQDYMVFERIVRSTFHMSEFAVMKIALPLGGVMILWLGLMNIGEKAGAINFLSKIIGPFFNKLFPEVPKDHPVNGQLLMNFSANMLGLDNAATPLGLKAMKGLQELNPNKKEASNAQIMFLALNTSGLTLIPITILAQRSVLGAADPTDIFIPLLLSTFISTVAAIIYVGIKQHLNLLNEVVISWLVGIGMVIGLMMYGFSQLNQEEMIVTSKIVSNALLFTIIVTFVAGAAYKKVNVYECFIEGAKQGFETSIKVMPYLVGMLVAIGVFRASGAMDYLMYGLKWLWSWTSLNTDFVDALPVAIMKPLSGSGAKAMMVETMQTFGVDSFTGKLSCLFQGAADTTFYIVALYFGSVGIRKTRYAVTAGLVADTVGAIAAILIAYYFFK
ncbi:MAG: nucleoside recognition domain-containing protein [Paludibacteraceae bacterium]|nr:nucleoside recognition domain-containing protein [Paludibacteraceae bacterium]